MPLGTRDDPLAWIDTEEAILENDPHTTCRLDATGILRWAFRDRGAYVGSGLALQIDCADLTRQVSPDLFVALEPPTGGFPPFPAVLRSWKVWEYGVPAVVIEITSKSTVSSDLGSKFAEYQDLGVQEYFLFDPCFASRRDRSLPGPLLGYVREAEGEPLTPLAVANGYESPVLGLRLQVDGPLLAFVDLSTGQRILPDPVVRRRNLELETENSRLATENSRLAAENSELRRQLAELAATVVTLQRRVEELERRG